MTGLRWFAARAAWLLIFVGLSLLAVGILAQTGTLSLL